MLELGESMRSFAGMSVVTVLFLVAAGILVTQNRTIDRHARVTILASIVALAVITLSDWFSTVTNGHFAEFHLLHAILAAVTFSLAAAIPAFISNAIFPERFFKWIVVVLAAHALLEIASIFCGFVFWVDEGNSYHRGPLYAVYMALYSASALYLVVESVRMSRAYQSVGASALFAILALLIVGVGVQVIDGNVRTTWPTVAMAVVLYFMYYADMVLRTDALTKLLNRHSYAKFLARPPLPCAVVVIDIDDFKHVNDTYGHAFGDECLARVAACMRRAFGRDGLCYRTGGDEFVVAVTHHPENVEVPMAELARLVEMERQADARMPSLSMGSALADAGCPDIEATVMAADQSMYQAKSEAKGGRS